MEFIIVLLMFAVPITVAALAGKKGNKTVVYKRLDDSVRKFVGEREQNSPRPGHESEVGEFPEDEYLQEEPTENIGEATGDIIEEPAKPLESAGPAVAVAHNAPKAIKAVPQEENTSFSFSDEEKKKMIIYSEILKPKFEE